MTDKTIQLVVDLTYDVGGDDEDSIEWFNGILYGDNLQLVDFVYLGDTIGTVKVIGEIKRRTTDD